MTKNEGLEIIKAIIEELYSMLTYKIEQQSNTQNVYAYLQIQGQIDGIQMSIDRLEGMI